MSTLAKCSRTCSNWNILSQPFWIEELTVFLERMKTEKTYFKEIDIFYLVNCAQENGSTNFILNELHCLENRIEKYQGKLNLLEERAQEKRNSYQTAIAVVDPFGGYHGIYQNGSQPYEKNINQAEKKEEKIIRKLGI